MTLVLIGTTVAYVVARHDVAEHRAAREARETQRKTETSLNSLAADLHDLRDEVEHEDVVEEVLENRWFEWFGLVGTAVITASFFAEWQIRRSKTAEEDDGPKEDN